MDAEEGEAKMCRLCGKNEKIYIDVFGEEGIRRYLGSKVHKKIDILESSKNQSHEGTQKQPAGYQSNKRDDPTQEGAALDSECSTVNVNKLIKEETKEECLGNEAESNKNIPESSIPAVSGDIGESSTAVSTHVEAKYKCTKCPKVYKSKHTLNEHLLKHEDIRKYKCSICQKKFAQQSNFAAHKKVHTKPSYECPGCYKKFNRNDNMKTHTKRCDLYQTRYRTLNTDKKSEHVLFDFSAS